MKLILFGATGFIGGEILTHALANPSITSLIVISRRQLPSSPPDAKLKVLISEDIIALSPSILSECADADACIWAVGTKPFGATLEDARRFDVEGTMSVAKKLADVANEGGNREGKFRFVYTSGILVIKDQESSVWVLGKFRKLRGEVEIGLSALGKERGDVLETYVTRPAFVLRRTLLSSFWSIFPSIKVDELAAATVHLALEGSPDQTVENATLAKRGAELLKQKV
ncbi:uncharacterized protein KY384_002540 [Bacidia gigantensis]|uniref:uncharacterized protein n=1 Tax=Bacidia gigantensis TaxID=2732470 RepID=UPI001D0480D2|nr:uncharacterized protein KY384_002540 [Bacidia gigantensis]KAG8532663.1 hypothetical protein KY384_002540 [Bacidia gigantensis]